MSRQSTLDSYFQKTSKSPPVVTNDYNGKKRRSLSLIKSPQQSSKCIKDANQNNHTDDVIFLPNKQEIITISDGEDEEHTSAKPCDSDASHETIVYNLSPSVVLQNSSPFGNSDGENVLTPRNVQPATRCKSAPCPANTRETSPVRNVSLPNVPFSPFKTPRSTSGGKFYSPTKKRLVTNRSPAKKNLTQEFTKTLEHNVQVYDIAKLCDHQDDKTKFLISMIEKYLQNDSLRSLLDDESQDLLAKCMHIAKPGMKLVCRLFWRKRCWYRIPKLIQICKDDNVQVNQLNLDALLENGLIVQSATQGENCMDIDECAELLKVQDVQAVCKNFNVKIKLPSTKDDMVQALKGLSKCNSIAAYMSVAKPKQSNNERVLKMLGEKVGPCYRLSDLASKTLNSLYILMYLGIDYSLISEKKLEFMLINDKIGRETYPVDKNMAIDNASVVFQNCNQFKQYVTAHSLYEKYQTETNVDAIRDIVQKAYESYLLTDEEDMLRCKSFPLWLRRFTSPSIYIGIIENGIQHLKSQKSEESYNLALDILKLLIDQNTYRQHRKLVWYEEMALILHKHMHQPEQAAELVLKGFASDSSEDAKDMLRPRARLLADQMNIFLSEEVREALNAHADRPEIEERNLPSDHILKQPVDNYNQRGKQKFEHRTEEGRSTLSAEDSCVVHYTEQGTFTHGEHWEGRIVTTMFFLLFWDIIYMKPVGVSGIFLTYYQKYPLDLFYDSFYVNRRTLIEDRLTFIEHSTDDMVVQLMKATWDSRPETELSEIRRDIGWENIRMVAQCLGARPLAAICRRLAVDYRGTHSGFPDLTLWNIHTNKIKFVEVKTDADKPSMKQIKWLRYLIDHGIDAGFCYIGANTTRNRKRGYKTISTK